MKRIDRFLATSLVALLLAGTAIALGPETQDLAASDVFYSLPSHDVIEIDGNADFNSTATSEGWNGNGTSINPYIIEKFFIDAEGEFRCIDIKNTSVHFQIRNCIVWNISRSKSTVDMNKAGAIHLLNCSNVAIIDVTIWMSTVGVKVVDSENISIDKVDIDQAIQGMHVTQSGPDIKIQNCNINSTQMGLFFSHSHNFTLNLNFIFNNSKGIVLEDTQFGVLDVNFIDESSSRAINVEYSHDLQISNNTLGNNENGIQLWDCFRISIKTNDIAVRDQSRYCYTGLLLQYCNNVSIEDITVTLSTYGIASHVSEDIFAKDVKIIDCKVGFYADFGYNINLEEIYIRNCHNGIYLEIIERSNFNNIFLIGNYYTAIRCIYLFETEMVNIEISGNTEVGLICSNSERNLFNMIEMSTLEKGMFFRDSTDNNVWNCEVQSLSSEAVLLERSTDNDFVHNLFRSGVSQSGIMINHSSYGNEFYSNHLFNGGFSFPSLDEDNSLDLLLYTSQKLEISNTFEGRFILYLIGEDLEGSTLTTSYGQIFMINSQNAIFRNQQISDVGTGISIINSSNIQLYSTYIEKNQNNSILVVGSEDIFVKNCWISESSGNGLYVINSKDVGFEDIDILGSQIGILLSNSEDVNVKSSKLSVINEIGIKGYNSNMITLSETIIQGADIGLKYEKVSNSTIDKCEFSNSHDAIQWTSGINVRISENKIEYIDRVSIDLIDIEYSNVTSNSIFFSGDGIFLDSGNYVNMIDNIIKNVGYCFLLNDSHRSFLSGNQMKHSMIGLSMENSRRSLITYNTFLRNNNYAIFASGSSSNQILWNSFLQNNGVSNQYNEFQVQLFDNKNNVWHNDGKGGNYYSDMRSPDNDLDGMIDHFYEIDGGYQMDRRPLTFSPIDLISPPENVVVINGTNSIEISWDEPEFVLDDKILGYKIYRADDGGNYRYFAEEEYPINRFLDTGVSNGKVYTYQIRAYCYLGDGASSIIVSGLVDATRPEVTILTPESDSWVNSRDVYLSWIGSDPDSGMVSFSYKWDLEDWIIIDDNKTSVLIRNLSQGNHMVSVKGENSVGLTTTSQVKFQVDSKLPELKIDGPSVVYTNKFSYPISWNAVDRQSSIDHTKYRVDGGDWNYIYGEEYVVISIHPGENIFELVVIDAAGNYIKRSKIITYDGEAPILTIFSPIQETNIYLRSNRMDLEWSCEDDLSGIDNYQITLDSVEEYYLAAGDTSHSLSLSEGLHEVELKVWDIAGNWAYHDWTVRVDNSTPRVASYFPMGGAISVDVNISVVFSEPMYKSTVSLVVEGVSGRLSWSGNSLIFHPHALLEFGQTYEVTVSGADLSSNHMKPFSWEFSTIPSGIIKGRLLGQGDRPLSGVKVSLQNGRSEYTDNQGRFSFELPPGEYTVFIEKSGYNSREFDVRLSSGETENIGNIRLQSEDALSFGAILAAVLIPSILLISVLILAIVLVVKKRNRQLEFYVVDGEKVPRKKVTVEFDEKDTSQEFEIIDYNGSPDFYSVLGLDSYASSMEIKKAYRSLAYLYHPDKLQASGLDMNMEEIHVMMRELNEAKDTLLDPYKRQAYDISLLNREG